ncbi:hypothetical protein [Vibrio sp. YIC-376]|uniref:hypothetical protein n=1 Tax=Vibrio sp. YIC-376 TaxID=3136162 RepID=UPI00402AB6D3
MKKLSLLAASVAIALTGCGGSEGGSSDGDKPTTQGSLVITAIDGYLQNAEVWVDKDGNLSNGCEFNTDEVTNAHGQATISKADYAGMDVCIKAITGKTIDKDRGIVSSDFVLASPSNEDDQVIVNPMTNMVIEKVKTQLTSDPALDVVEAKKAATAEVVTAVTKSGLTASAEMIFGDYIASTETSNDAKALKVIGETLVDNQNHSVDKLLEITHAVAEKAQEIISSSTPEEIDNFAPVVNVPTDGAVTIDKNSRPVVATPLKPVTIQLGDTFVAINAADYFNDAEDDTLAFTMLAIGGDKNGIDIDNLGMITGTPTAAGEFIYQIFAEDAKGSLSYPATLTVTIETPNTAPAVNEATKADLQAEVNGWQWVKGEQPLDTLNISALFTDADSDVLTYKVETSLSKNGGVDTGFQVLVDDSGTISFDGPVPHIANAGAEHIYVYANDGVNTEEAIVTLALPKIAEGTAVEPTLHPLEGKTWYRLEHGDGTDAVSFNYSRIWCDSLRFEDGEVLGNYRDLTNLTQCGEIAAESFSSGTYTVQGDKLIATFTGENGEPETTELIISDASEISIGAKLLQWKYVKDGVEQSELYTLFSNKADAEARIQIKSDDAADNRMFPMTLPTAIEGQYATGKASVSLLEKANIGDSGAMDANLILEFDNQDFTCADVSEFYRSIKFTGKGLGDGIASVNPSTGGFECYNKDENNITHAAIDFDLPQLTTNDVYSFVGKVKDSQGEFIEAIKFNITWTGIGNNE